MIDGKLMLWLLMGVLTMTGVAIYKTNTNNRAPQPEQAQEHDDYETMTMYVNGMPITF